jgi:hypothetical protein
MPKEAARIWLKVIDDRVERLHDISEADAISEGVISSDYKGISDLIIGKENRFAFRDVWFKINGTESWEANPWVWVVQYEMISTTGRPKNI